MKNKRALLNTLFFLCFFILSCQSSKTNQKSIDEFTVFTVLSIENTVYDSKVKDAEPIHNSVLEVEFMDSDGKLTTKKISGKTNLVQDIKIGDQVKIIYTSSSNEFIKSIQKIEN